MSEMNKEDYEKLSISNFGELKQISLACSTCGDVISKCDYCGRPFDSEIEDLVACRNDGFKGHLCESCMYDIKVKK